MVLSGCGETLFYYRYEYTQKTVSLPKARVNLSILPTFAKDENKVNIGTYGSPYRLRVVLFVPAFTQIAKMTVQGLQITGVESKTCLNLEPSSTGHVLDSLTSDNEKQTAVVVAIPANSSLEYEALNIQGVVHVTLDNGETYLKSDFDVQLDTDYQEEKKNKLLSGILGI